MGISLGLALVEGLPADVSFLDREVAFGSNEERIRTRLGDEGVVVTFEQLPVSPFDPGLEIGRISIPHHMSRGLDPQDAVAPTATGGGFEFSVGEARFRYDKLGRVRYDWIVDFEPFSDGFGIMRDAQTAKPQSFRTGDGWFAYNLAVNLAQM